MSVFMFQDTYLRTRIWWSHTVNKWGLFQYKHFTQILDTFHAEKIESEKIIFKYFVPDNSCGSRLDGDHSEFVSPSSAGSRAILSRDGGTCQSEIVITRNICNLR